MSANGMARPRSAAYKTVDRAGRHQSSRSLRCTPIRSRQMRSPRSASTSVRTRSTSSVSTSGAPSCCGSRYHAANWSAGLPMCRAALSAWKPAAARITSPARSGHSAMTFASSRRKAQYVKPFLKGHKNDYRDAEAIAEAVQRPTMRFVTITTPEQMDLLALHRVRARLVRLRTGVINQIRGLLIERGITVRQGPAPLRKALSDILSCNSGRLSPRMVRLIVDLTEDWRRLDDRIATV